MSRGQTGLCSQGLVDGLSQLSAVGLGYIDLHPAPGKIAVGLAAHHIVVLDAVLE